MKKALIFIIGIVVGIVILLFGYNYLHGKKYATLNQDYEFTKGEILKKGKIKCDTIFDFGEELPKFKGGDLELLKYNMEKIAPIIGESNERTGILVSKIHYSLIISKKGEVVESEILTEVEEELEKSLKIELNKMQNWIPGKVNGKTECIKIRIPISCIKWD